MLLIRGDISLTFLLAIKLFPASLHDSLDMCYSGGADTNAFRHIFTEQWGKDGVTQEWSVAHSVDPMRATHHRYHLQGPASEDLMNKLNDKCC